MRTDLVRARRTALGCAWLFIAVPGVLGIFGLIHSGFTSLFGWLMTTFFLLATFYLGMLFIRARSLSVAEPKTRRGRYGDLTY